MSRKLKDIVIEKCPNAYYRKEQNGITKKIMHHVVIGDEIVGYHARESWAWSQAYTWLLKNNLLT